MCIEKLKIKKSLEVTCNQLFTKKYNELHQNELSYF